MISGVKIGVNIVSLTHLAPGLNGLFAAPSRLIALAKEIGFDLVQVLPLRGATGKEEPRSSIRFYEEAWNPGTIFDFLMHRPGKLGPPQLQDIVLFPSPRACARVTEEWAKQGIRKIGHDFSGGGLIEVSPALDMTPSELLATYKMEMDGGLVIDSSHFRRGYRPDEIKLKPERAGKPSPLGTTIKEWLEAIEMLAPVLAPIMHLNFTGRDSDFLASIVGDDCDVKILWQWLGCTSQHKERYIILEYKPAFLPRKSQDLAMAMLAKARQLIGALNKSGS